MGFGQGLNSLLFNMFCQHLGEAERVPDQRSTSEFICEGVGPKDNRTELNHMCVQNICSNLWANVHQDL